MFGSNLLHVVRNGEWYFNAFLLWGESGSQVVRNSKPTYWCIYCVYSVVSVEELLAVTWHRGICRCGQTGCACQAKTAEIYSLWITRWHDVCFCFCSDRILYVVGIAPRHWGLPLQYLRIVGGGSILNAMIPILAGYLRAFGYETAPDRSMTQVIFWTLY